MLFTVVRVPVDYEFCSLCFLSMGRGQLAALSERGKLAHYGCAKDRRWKRKSRAKTKKQAVVREIAPVNRPIKILKRNGIHLE